MVEEMITYIRKNHLFEKKDNILLAVSGGIDSMVMCDLFSRAGFNFGIAHCDFSLRDNESDEDGLFVKSYAEKMKVIFCTRKFNTRKYAAEKGISIQMAARELRYCFFTEVAEERGFDYIATAHHQDDQIETFFINLTRQTGIAGFHGIFPKKENLVRPLMFCDRKKIASYAKSRNIQYREDSSNKETKYLRNKIRHEILPLFQQINPEIGSIMTGNIQRLREAEMIFRKYVEMERGNIIRKHKKQILISINDLKSLEPVKTFTYELLAPYGFNYTVANEIVESLDREPGITWYSGSHRLIKDRKNLIITGIPDPESEESFIIKEKTKRIRKPLSMSFNIIPHGPEFEIDGSGCVANLDLHKLEFPLTIRKWRKGDSFHPFGQGHRKKLSDFFTDNKYSIADKESAWLLCSGEKIIWVIGRRIDHKYRITSATKEVYMIRCKE